MQHTKVKLHELTRAYRLKEVQQFIALEVEEGCFHLVGVNHERAVAMHVYNKTLTEKRTWKTPLHLWDLVTKKIGAVEMVVKSNVEREAKPLPSQKQPPIIPNRPLEE